MKKLLPLPLVCLIPGFLTAQALHQWKGNALIEGDPIELKLIILENQNFVALVQTEDAPFAVEGTWLSENEQTYSLKVETEKVMGEEIPIGKGKLFIVDHETAVLVAEGFGLELNLDTADDEARK